MPLQYTPIVLGTVVVVGLGMLLYSMFTNSSRPQAHGPYSHRSENDYNDYNYNEFASCSSSINGDEDERDGTRKRMNQSRCSICLRSLKQNTKQLTCGHIYHNHCIMTWLQNNKTCPNCRSFVNL